MKENFVPEKFLAEKLSEFSSKDSFFCKQQEIINELKEMGFLKEFRYINSLFLGVMRFKILLDEIIENSINIKEQITKNLFLIVAFQLHIKKQNPNITFNILKSSLYQQNIYNLEELFNKVLMSTPENILSEHQDKNEIQFLSKKYSLQPWIVHKIISSYKATESEKVLNGLNKENPLYFIVNKLIQNSKKTLTELRKNGVFFESTGFDDIYELPKNLSTNLEINKNIFLQDKASSLVSFVLNPKPGEYVLDACAAPGSKSIVMAQLMKNQGKIYAVDIDMDRLRRFKKRIQNSSIKNIEYFHFDSRKLEENSVIKKIKFDKILVDPTCSGTGTYPRKPHLKWRYSLKDLSELISDQIKILNSTSKFLKKDGILVYSVCSILKEECQNVINIFLRNNREFKLIKAEPLIGSTGDGMFSLCQLFFPHIHKTDGFFIAKLKKNN